MDTAAKCDEIKSRLSSPPLLLIVEDSENDAEFLRRVIPIGKAKTIHTASVGSAKELLGTIEVDLILLDLNLGPDDGIALLEWLKTQNIQTPVAVVTGIQLGALAANLVRFKILTILPKPVSTETITLLMQQLKIWRT